METRQYGEITTYETRGEANEKVDRSKRYKQILAILDGRKLTAKEIVEVVGKVTCRYSGHKVAVYQVRGVGNA